MKVSETVGLVICFVLHFAALGFGIGWLVHKYVQTVRYPTRKRKPGISRLLVFSFFLIVSIWFLRLAVELFVSWYPLMDEDPRLNGVEAFFNSLVHALQTFSMDEDYTQYVHEGKRMMTALTGSGGWANAYGVYCAFLNVLAPVMGGAALFEILANIFPKLMLRLTGLMCWRKRCYFSELNPGSLALAASILQEDYKWYRKPVLIFTDAYLDDESEKSSEMLLSAKLMGAICVRDDLSNIDKRGKGKRVYYLMDENEVENLRTLAELSGEENRKFIKGSEIYLLTHNETYTQMERELRQRLEKCGFRSDELPRLMPVQSYRNLVTNLLVDIPLYEPIAGSCPKRKELNVTILGSGLIGTEMFLAVYWMGQMLDCRLNISVISKDAPEQFCKKINYINPEILKTVCWEDAETKDDLLLYNNDGDYADYYGNVHYYRADIATSKPGTSGTSVGAQEEQNCLEHPAVLNSDYIVVALGSDEDNIAVAEKLRLSVGHEHIQKAEEKKRTVIAYVVYDGDLCHTLNERRHTCSCRQGEPDIYMYAFGSLQQVYSCANIMMTRHQYLAELAGEHYSAMQKQTDLQQDTADRVERDGIYEDNNYKYWANMARAMHLKYKVFSLGWITSSVFDDTTRDSTLHRRKAAEAVARYKRVALGFPDAEDAQAAKELETAADRLAWLEHRRWCAYTRSRGFRQTGSHAAYRELTGSHKHMALKLHPCLVECSDPIDGCKKPDKLDMLVKDLEAADHRPHRFKVYDYPAMDFGSYCSVEAAAKRTGISQEQLALMCQSGRIGGVFCLTNGQWVIPEVFVENREKKSEPTPV